MFSDRKDKTADNLFSSRKNSADKLFSGAKDKADNLFSGAKDKADNLFSGRKNSAEKLFSGGKVKEKNDDMPTSPRPVPRPRSKPKEKNDENKGLNTLNDTTDSDKITADQLFDSVGKSSKSVSFSDVNATKDSKKEGSQSVGKRSSDDRNSNNERTPPKKAPRSPRNRLNSSSPRKGKSSDENDTEQRTSEHKKRPQPPQRHHDKNFSERNSSEAAGYGFGSHRTSDGMQLFHSRDGSDIQQHKKFSSDFPSRGDSAKELKQQMRDNTVYEGRNKEGRTPRWEGATLRQEPQEQENYGFSRNSERYSRSNHEKIREGSSRNDRDGKGNITDMFEDHVPVSNGIVLDDDEDRTNQHGRRLPGRAVLKP